MPDQHSLSIERTECLMRCGLVQQATLLGNGAKGKEEDLAGLVCNMVNTPQCINPKKGASGDTWEAP